MKQQKRKGFTLVELLVVIAILAVLATVSIVGYTSFIKKANISNDTALVTQINNLLLANDTSNGGQKSATMYDALTVLKADGFDVTKFTPTTEGYHLVWDSEENRFLFLNESKQVVAPSGVEFEKSVRYFAVVHNETDITTWAGCSIYLADDFTYDSTEITVSTGIDVGNYTGFTTITYSNTNANDKVIIRTNSAATTLKINALGDNVSHYGEAKESYIAQVSMTSYHEYGKLSGNIYIASGRVALESGSSISNVVICKIDDVTPTTEGVKVDVAENVEAALVYSEVAGVTPTVGGAGATTVDKLEDISGKVAAIGSKTYKTFETAWAALEDNQTLTLLDDVNTDATNTNNYILVKGRYTLDLNGHNINLGDDYFYIYYANTELIIKGNGKLETTDDFVVFARGSSTANDGFYKLTIERGVTTKAKSYAVGIYYKSSNDKTAAYGVDVLYEGHDQSTYGAIYINGYINKKTGNVPVIALNNATLDCGFGYLAGYSIFSATNCVVQRSGANIFKAGDISLQGNTFNIDCTEFVKHTPNYVKSGNGAFSANCALQFENGVPNYAGLTSVYVSADNKINFSNNGETKMAEVMFIDYSSDTPTDKINIDLDYITIDTFNYRIAYKGTYDSTTQSGYIYFIDEATANAYTAEKFKEEYGFSSVDTFGSVETQQNGAWD